MKSIAKKVLIISFWLTAIYFCNGQSTLITIELIAPKAESYYLGYHMGGQRYVRDTLEISSSGVLEIKSEVSLKPGLYFLYSDKSGFYQEFFVNEPSFTLKSGGDYETTEVIGSKENEIFKAYLVETIEFQNAQRALSDSLKSLSGADSLAAVNRIRTISEYLRTVRQKIYNENPSLLVSKMLNLLNKVELDTQAYIGLSQNEQARKKYQDYKSRYFEKLDFVEKGLIRTPVLEDLVMKYLTEVIPQAPDSINNELDRIISKVEDDEEAFRYWMITFTNYYQNSKLMGMESVLVHLLNKYYMSGKVYWMTDVQLERIKQELQLMLPNQIGKQAPQLILTDASGQSKNLLHLPNKYLVLYFYDPDCIHCKEKTPILNEVYDELRNLDAEVIAVNIAVEEDKWKNYIRENNLNWVNVADLKFESNFRAGYNIKSTPMLYVLDRGRKIIAKKLDVEQLVNFITDYEALVNH